MSRPAISIVVLNFNHARFLDTALDALTLALGPDDEIFGFDDASTDNSLKVYARCAERCPALRVIPKERNQGIVASMNEGLSLASKELVYFAASDDQVDPAFLDTMAELLGTYPEAGLAACRTRLIDTEGRDLGVFQTPLVRRTPGFLSQAEVARAFMADDNWLAGISTVYRRPLLVAEGGFRAELGSFSDGFASRLVAMRHGACFSPEVLTSWRRQAEGYASAQATDMAAVARIAETTLTLMNGTYANVFPPGYGARWKGRWFFGAHYYGWCRDQDARHPDDRITGPTRLLKRITRWACGLAMFLRHRHRDLFAVARRRIAYRIGRGAGAYARNTKSVGQSTN